MKAGIETSDSFLKVKNIKTPDIFNRRFTTNVLNLDKAFCADGWVPGSTFTINGTPGSGKTTLLCQLLQKLADNGKKVAYISGEESVHQLAYTCKRVNAVDIPVANMSDLKMIQQAVEREKFDFIILDSYPCFHMPGTFRTMKDRESAAIECILNTAHDNECVVGCVLHVTKTGTYKGSTLLPHAVDANYSLTKDELEEDIRYLDAMKNRFGTSSKSSFKMTPSGFSFETITKNVVTENVPSLTKILNFIDSLDGRGLTFKEAVNLCGNEQNAYFTLRDGVLDLKLKRVEIDKNAVWFKK